MNPSTTQSLFAWFGNLVEKGGVLIYPLLVLFGIAMVIIVYKAFTPTSPHNDQPRSDRSYRTLIDQ
ncbi:MAG: hypothetical protein K0U93_21360 [Gammaproteobacteria bacterium]|nr:hypothetical protein [Gammaproteobacteria bacterium]